MLLACLWYNIKPVKIRTDNAASFILIGNLLITGCYKDYHDIEIVPDGPAMHRTVTVGGDYAGLPELSEIYGHEPIEIPAKKTSGSAKPDFQFEGRFENVTPDDIGGSGLLLHCTSAMGSSSFYSEQFRGQDDLAGVLAKQAVAFNRFFDILLLWFETDFEDASDYSAIREVLDKEVRSDLWNLSTYMSTIAIGGMAIKPGEEGIEDFLLTNIGMRSLHFLLARGYFDISQIPVIAGAFDDEDEIIDIVVRAIASKMGVTSADPLPPTLTAIQENFEEIEDSVDFFIEKNAKLKRMVEGWNAGVQDEIPYVFEDSKFVKQIATDMVPIEFRLFDDGDWLRVKMHLRNEPFLTNGEWHDAGVLIWEERLAPMEPEQGDLPNALFAMWSDPLVTFQEKYFGRVVMVGENLADYCDWRRDLSDTHGGEWDELILTLKPGDVLAQRLKDFTFEGEAEHSRFNNGDTDIRSTLAYSTVRKITQELNKPSEKIGTSSPIY